MALPIPAILRNPIFEREFVSMCRTRRWFVVRTLLVAILTLILWAFLLIADREFGAAETDLIGQYLFGACVYVQVFFVYAVTPALVADLIVSERRKDTLDILLVSPLSASAIVLGKLLSRLSLLLVVVAASFPVISITLLYGGVRAEQVVGLFLVTIGTMLFSAGPALFFSSFARRLGTAAVLSYIIPFAILTALPIALAALGDFEDSLAILVRVHPVFAATAVAVDNMFTAFLSDSVSPALGMLLTGFAVCAVCALFSILRLRRESRTRSLSGGPPRVARAETQLLVLRNRIIRARNQTRDVDSRGKFDSAIEDVDRALAEIATSDAPGRSTAGIVRDLRTRLDDLGVSGSAGIADLTERARTGRRRRRVFQRMKNPVLWKEANLVNTSQSRVLFVVVLVLLGLAELLFFISVPDSSIVDDPEPHVVLVTIEALLLFLLVGVNASTSVIGEKEQGTLDLLRVTLVTPAQVVTGKVAGALRSILILALVPVLHLFIFAPFSDLSFGSAIVFAFVLFVVLSFFAVFGVRSSIVARHASRAILRSMALLGGLLIVIPIGALLLMFLVGGDESEFFRFAMMGHPVALLAMPTEFFSDHSAGEEELLAYCFAWVLIYGGATVFLFLTMPHTFRRVMMRDD
jgi:ABC-type transport system involved in multi-copper enzyme maturation permease subunit